MIIDLSMELSENILVYPGDPKVEIKAWNTIEKDGYYMNTLFMGEHIGTHVDAPAHFIKGGKTIDEIPLDKFIGEGAVIDVSKLDRDILPEDITEKAEIVLFYTNGPDVYLSEEGARHLVNLGIKGVGIDRESIDGDFKSHRILLLNEILIFENITNLEMLIGKRFTFIGMPLKIKGGSGSPVRAVAIIKEK
ncbi:cyclase family protein [Thermococcus argininiproducens]|uniref:Cyclase family protein n=1 Tax=Thermococcus argininiproducens TaxID=2866384 RepID=A0A9E7SBT1_9EURY|nr:cyclase family protein [Thermococcus argininiproducens]USG99184.1 cyclase family protein [Thermococcus argininiproducens]